MTRSLWTRILICCATLVFEYAQSATAAVPAPLGPTESAGSWSETVDQMRGRLVVESALDSRGATTVRVYVEIQNLDAQPYFGKKISFNRDMSVTWTLTDTDGKPMPAWKQGVPWIFDYASVDTWISIPGDSRLRFPVCSAEFDFLEESRVLVLFQGLINTPPWLLPGDGRGPYLLSGIFKGLKQGSPSEYIWGSSLSLPPVRLPVDPIQLIYPQNGAPFIRRPKG